MRLRLETDYGIRCVLYLAQQNDYVQAGKIASAMNVPENVIPRVLSRLKRAGLVSARSGVQGGHKLGRPAEEITMLDIIQCMEDHIVLGRCMDETEKLPSKEGAAVGQARQYFYALQDVMERSMQGTTIAQLVPAQA